MAVAQSRRGNKIRKVHVRHPHERVRVRHSFDPEDGRTHQSFKDECDIHQIVDSYARTGLVNHLASGPVQYGDAPEATLFEAACAQAAIRSAEHDGFTPSEAAPEADDSTEDPVTGSDLETAEKPLQEPTGAPEINAADA